MHDLLQGSRIVLPCSMHRSLLTFSPDPRSDDSSHLSHLGRTNFGESGMSPVADKPDRSDHLALLFMHSPSVIKAKR